MRASVYDLLVAGLCLLGLAAGCGSENPLGRKAISGTVTLDGAPLKQGGINFEPLQQGGVGSGASIVDGKYSIPAEKGLPKGKYRVTIHASEGGPAAKTSEEPGEPLPPAKELIPPEWNVKSKQEVTVGDERAPVFNFDIKTK